MKLRATKVDAVERKPDTQPNALGFVEDAGEAAVEEAPKADDGPTQTASDGKAEPTFGRQPLISTLQLNQRPRLLRLPKVVRSPRTS